MKGNKNENQQEKEQKELEKLIDEVMKENKEALKKNLLKNKRVVQYNPLFFLIFSRMGKITIHFLKFFMKISKKFQNV